MSDIDDKLTNIWMSARNSVEAIAQIKQAFTDAGYWHQGDVVLSEDATPYIPVKEDVISDDPRVAYNQGLVWATEFMTKKIKGDIHGVDVYEVKHESEDWNRMTGQEWFTRFRAELDELPRYHDDQVEILRAAKRAANLENQNTKTEQDNRHATQ